jgi:hypothetical protein
MVDRFIERVADTAGRTARALRKVASEIDESYVTQRGLLNTIAEANDKLSHDCATSTQPIDVERYNLPERLKKIIEELDNVAADLLSRGIIGHSDLSEASSAIRKVVDRLDDK